MKIKTSELAGRALDWAVTKLELDRLVVTGEHVKPWVRDAVLSGESVSAYSTDWLFGGPIIEREMLGVFPSESVSGKWCCRPREKNYPRFPIVYADTPLIAAMRCYVASKLGDEVDVPEELT